VSHIVVESEGKAKEILAVLRDEPKRFAEFAQEYSIADTAENGGRIGRVLRGALQGEVEAKVFHAKEGEILGPFPAPDGTCFELFMVNGKRAGVLDEETSTEIRRVLREQWLAKQATEHRLEVL
jgi:parvulin-like peptidyl-prolyl isomerase